MRPLLLLMTTFVAASASAPGQDLGWAAVKASVRAAYPDVDHVTVDSLAGELERGDAVPLLVDSRSEEEYAVSHLEQAIRIDPDAATFPELRNVPRDRPLVVYCSVGYRSARLAKALRRAGFTRVRNLEGSIFEWANRGYPVYRGRSRVTEVHPYNRFWGRLLAADVRAETASASHD